MAVFPDRIVLKNSTDSQATIEAAIQTGGTDAITQGEIVLGVEPTDVAIYTKAGDGSIVRFAPGAAAGRAIVSDDPPTVGINGNPLTDGDLWYESDTGSYHVYYLGAWVEVSGGGGGAMSLNDLTDVSYASGSFEPTALDQIVFTSADVPTGETYKVFANPTYGMAMGAYDSNGGSYFYLHRTKGAEIRIPDSGVFNISGPLSQTDNTPEIRLNTGDPIGDTPTGNYFGLTLPAGYSVDQTYTVPAVDGTNGQVLSTNGSGVLSWVEMGTGGGSGAVDSVNGQTGVVSLGIQDMDDYSSPTGATPNYTSFDPGQPTFTDPAAGAIGGSIDNSLGTNAYKVLASETYGDGSRIPNFLATDARYDVVYLRIRSTNAMSVNNRLSIGGNKAELVAGAGFTLYTRDTGFGFYADDSFQEIGTKPTMSADTWYEIAYILDWGSAQRATVPTISLWVDGAIAINQITPTATYTEASAGEASNFRLAFSSGNLANSGDKFWDDIRVKTSDTIPWGTADSTITNPAGLMDALYGTGLVDGDALTWDSATSKWVPAAVTAVSGSIDNLSDVDTSTNPPTDGQILTWVDANGQWEPADATGGGASALNDLSDVNTEAVETFRYALGTNGASVDPGTGNYSIPPNANYLQLNDIDQDGKDISATLTALDGTIGSLLYLSNDSGATWWSVPLPTFNASTADQGGWWSFIRSGSGGWSQAQDGSALTDSEILITTEDLNGGGAGPLDGQLLRYVGAAGEWQAKDIDDIINPLPTVTGTFIDSNSTAATSQVLTAPTHNTGDLLVACIMSRNSGGTLTPPSGFTLHGEYLSSIAFSGDTQTISVFTKTATASEPATYTWTQASSGRICGFIAAVGAGSVIDSVTENYGNATTATITTLANRLNITAATWVYAESTLDETYSQSGASVTEITDSPNQQARISGGYTTEAGTVTSTHGGNSTANDPNHGMINIALKLPVSISDSDDVDTVTTPPTDGQVLTWVDANSQWEPVTPSGSGGSLDPLFSFVTVLASFDNETNGATTWTSYGSTSPTWTANTTAISNALTRWGGTTCLSLGSSLASIPCSLGTDDWTIEAWIYLDQSGWNNFGSIFRNGLLADTFDAFYMGPNGDATSARFRISNSGSDLLTITGTCDWQNLEWNHVAICRAGDTFSAYVNGEKIGSGVQSGRTFNSGDLEISGSGSSTSYAQDFRVTRGVARYSTVFYPVPSFPLPTS